MSGGQFGARGYLYQATVCLLDSLMNEEWDYVHIEPDSQNEKVDISWELNNKIVKAMQVKSSINLFKKWQINKWICELVEDSIKAQVYEVVLIGRCSSDAQKFVEGINACREDVFSKKLKNYNDKISVRVIEYDHDSFISSINTLLHDFFRDKSYDIGSNAIKLISRASIFDYMKFSTKGSKVSKQEFVNLLIKYAKSVRHNSSDEVISIEFKKSKEEINERQVNIKGYILKTSIFFMVLVMLLVAIRVYSNNIFKIIMPQSNNYKMMMVASIFICCIVVGLIIILLNISNYKFLILYDEHYPVLSIRQFKTYYNSYMKAIVTESRLRKDRLLFVDHEVEIFNVCDESFNYIDCYFSGVKENHIIMEEDFYTTKLRPNESDIVYKKTILSQFNDSEAEQYTFKGKLNIGDTNRIEEITLSTPRLIKTYFLILNYFNYKRIFKYVIPFEISWLVEQLHYVSRWYQYNPFEITRILAITCGIVILILGLIGFIKIFNIFLLSAVAYFITLNLFKGLRKCFKN